MRRCGRLSGRPTRRIDRRDEIGLPVGDDRLVGRFASACSERPSVQSAESELIREVGRQREPSQQRDGAGHRERAKLQRATARARELCAAASELSCRTCEAGQGRLEYRSAEPQ